MLLKAEEIMWITIIGRSLQEITNFKPNPNFLQLGGTNLPLWNQLGDNIFPCSLFLESEDALPGEIPMYKATRKLDAYTDGLLEIKMEILTTWVSHPSDSRMGSWHKLPGRRTLENSIERALLFEVGRGRRKVQGLGLYRKYHSS